MKSPLEFGPFVELESVESTQGTAANWIRGDVDYAVPGVIFAHDQTRGRGRFDRTWVSNPGESLTFSLIMQGQIGFEKPWLIGMAVACATAKACGSTLQWRNDLVFENRKVGGLLTEVISNRSGDAIPVVGVGVNLNQESWPKNLEESATSLLAETGQRVAARDLAIRILHELESIPEPREWKDIEPIWRPLDRTTGKRYKLAENLEAEALEIGDEGQLICSVGGDVREVYAADAIFGSAESG